MGFIPTYCFYGKSALSVGQRNDPVTDRNAMRMRTRCGRKRKEYTPALVIGRLDGKFTSGSGEERRNITLTSHFRLGKRVWHQQRAGGHLREERETLRSSRSSAIRKVFSAASAACSNEK